MFWTAYTACLLETVDSTHVGFVGSEQGQMEYNTQLLPFKIFLLKPEPEIFKDHFQVIFFVYLNAPS